VPYSTLLFRSSYVATSVFCLFFASACGSNSSDKNNGNELPSINDQARILDLRLFNVRGNGRADDTNALQAAFDAARPGDEIPLLGLSILITRPLILAKESVTIRGPGEIRIGGAGKFFALQIEAPLVTIRNVDFTNPSGFTADIIANGCGAGSDLAEKHTGGILIRAGEVTIIDNRFTKMLKAIEVKATPNSQRDIQIISNDIIELLGTGAECDGGDAISGQMRSSIIHNNTIIHSGESSESALSAISLTGSDAVANTVSQNVIEGAFFRGISVNNHPLNPNLSGFNHIIGNSVKGSGIALKSTQDVVVSSNLIRLTAAGTSSDAAIFIQNSSYTTAYRNDVTFDVNRAFDSAFLVSSSTESRIDSNRIFKTSLMATNYLVADAIKLVSAPKTHIDRNELAADIARQGIRLSGSSESLVRFNNFERVQNFQVISGGSDKLLISDNHLSGATTGIQLTQALQSIVEGNTIDQIEITGEGIKLESSTQVSILDNIIQTPRYSVRTNGSAGAVLLRNTLRYKIGAAPNLGAAYWVNDALGTPDTTNVIIGVP
jgi:nitrous oxidase accessory protein NosD